MQSESPSDSPNPADSANPADTPPDAAAGAPSPPDDTSPKPGSQETVAAKLSSIQGLVGLANDSATAATIDGKSARVDPAQTPTLGQSFGRYQIRKVLGSGSMGSVFLALDPQLGREVALKVPRMERDLTGELSQRLHREARAAAILSHPNICPVYDVSEHAGTCFIAMGYVPGKPLSAYLAAGRNRSAKPRRSSARSPWRSKRRMRTGSCIAT
jgi:serine/threonine protein kinase